MGSVTKSALNTLCQALSYAAVIVKREPLNGWGQGNGMTMQQQTLDGLMGAKITIVIAFVVLGVATLWLQ